MIGLYLFVAMSLASFIPFAQAASKDVHVHVNKGGASDEEFVGPFPSWLCARTLASGTCGAATGGYGTATGNGSTDDAAAIQSSIDNLSTSHPVLYFPPGNYKITTSLRLGSATCSTSPAVGSIFVSMVGADPATTIITWAGGANVMFCLNGVAYSRFDRITFDGANVATSAIDQSWVGTGGNFDTGNQYADVVLKNAGRGYRCGAFGFGCAESSILRPKFINNSVAGVSLYNFNALDVWIWYGLFQNNAIGATNIEGAGNFHIYNGIFSGSTTADITTGNTGTFNFRGNYSSGSNQFYSGGGGFNPSVVTLSNNTIVDTTLFNSVDMGNFGPLVLWDNVIRSSVSAAGPVVNGPDELFSMGNTYTVTPSVSVSGGGRLHQVSDQVVSRSTINPSPPILPGVPPNNARAVYEVASFTGAAIQAQIDAAVNGGTTKPVVHLPPGDYNVTSTIVVPSNSTVQIVGDGFNSRLVSGGATPVLRLTGPSKATVSYISCNGNSQAADCIEVSNADQVGSRVFLQGLQVQGSTTGLFSDSLDRTNVEAHNFQVSFAITAGDKGIKVVGGASAAAGSWLGGMTNVFAGASGGLYTAVDVSSGGHALVEDVFYDDGAGGNTEVEATGAFGAVTIAGGTWNLPGTSAIHFNNFQGTMGVINNLVTGRVNLAGTGSGAKDAVVGLISDNATPFTNSTSPAATVGFLNGLSRSAGCCTQITEVSASTPFLTTALNQARTTRPSVPGSSPRGITDVRLYGVIIDGSATALHVH